MERVYSAEQIKAALASGRKDDIEEVREAMQQLIEAKEDSKTEGTDVKVGDPESLIEQDGLGESPPTIEAERKNKIMSSAVVQQQTKLKVQSQTFARELAALGGPDSEVAKDITWLYENMIRSLQILVQGRADLMSAQGNQAKSVKSVRTQIYDRLEMIRALEQVQNYSLLWKAEWDDVVAKLPTTDFPVAVLLDCKRDLELLLEKEKTPAAVSKLALELGQTAALQHDKLVMYCLGSEMMKHTFQRLADQSEVLRAKLFDVLAKSYPQTLAIAWWPSIESDIRDCQRLFKSELGELKVIANAD